MEALFNGLGVFIQPLYYFGISIWNFMLSLIGATVSQTPVSFSGVIWNYVEDSLWPLTVSIGIAMLNISFYIGFIRQAANLKQNFTLEILVECGIKVIVGNWLLLKGMDLIKLFFEMSSALSQSLVMDIPAMGIQMDEDLGSMIFYLFFGFIFFCVCLVCSGTIFCAVYGRYIQLYLLVATAPVAFATIPGGGGMAQTAYAWIKTFLAKTFEIVFIAMALAIASKMCISINFGNFSIEVAGIFNGAIQALQNIATMILLTASVKGMDVFIKRAFAL